MNDQTIYVTTTIPFVNARPHVGFALELVQADALARYYRLLGRRVRLQTGTDEHAFKNVLAAQRLGVTTKELVDENAAHFRRLCAVLNISQDRFIRTTEPEHKTAVTAFWRRLRGEDVYRRKYTGLYCVGCEDFLRERELVDGKCRDHETDPTAVEEENYFFRLSTYQDKLEQLLESGRLLVVPDTRKNEVLQFVRSGLQDISVSRPANRLGGWGITIPSDPSQIIYVWIDALINYVSGLGFGNGEEWSHWWNENSYKIHVIGKNVWKFHAVYWPALLLSAGLPLPDTIPVHGFLTHDGRKISKSLGNSVDPVEYVVEFGSDAVRFYLLRNVRPFEDGDFSEERLVAAYEGLANGIGNLFSRVTALCEKAGHAAPEVEADPAPPKGFGSALKRFEFDSAIELLWSRIRAANRDIEERAPWSLIRAGEHEALSDCLNRWLRELYAVAYWLAPFLPDASEKIQTALSVSEVRKAQPLFPRRG